MKHFSAKQRKFMIQYALTRKAGQSAIDAGYSVKDSRSRASKMLKVREIRREISRLITLVESGVDITRRIPACGDPMAFLQAVMNDPVFDVKLRLEAALELMPYCHNQK